MCHQSLPTFRRRLSVLLCCVPLVAARCAPPNEPPVFWAFTGPWDPRSDSSVVAHGDQLQAVVSGWIALDSLSGQPILPPQFADTLRTRNGTVNRMALVTSWHGDRFHASSVRTLGADPAALGRAASALARFAGRAGYEGLVFDFETLERADRDAFLRVLRVMTDSARAHGVGTLTVAVPATDTAAYAAAPLLEIADALILMLYDQHWSGSEPGPISAPSWVREAVRLRLAEADADQLIAALPAYGYHWRPRLPTQPVSFHEAQAIASRSGQPLRRDPESMTLRSVAPDGEETWVTDAELLRVLVRDALEAGLNRFALWRLGQEDPAVWTEVVQAAR